MSRTILLWDTGATGVDHERVYGRYGLYPATFRYLLHIINE